MKRIVYKIIAYIIIVATVFSALSIINFAGLDNFATDDLNNSQDCNLNEKNVNIIPNTNIDAYIEEEVTTEPSIMIRSLPETANQSEIISIVYDVSNANNVYYIADGITVLDHRAVNNTIDIKAHDGFGKIDVFATDENDKSTKSSIYTYCKNSIVYISNISVDRAWYYCMESEYNNGFISEDEWKDQYSELSRIFSIKTSASEQTINTRSSDTVVSGILKWQLADGSKLPLRQSLVELRNKNLLGSTLIASTYTDNNGNYSFVYDDPDEWYNIEDDGPDIFIRIYTKSQRISVQQDLGLILNYADSDVYDNVQAGTIININCYVPYDVSNIVNKSFYVLQGMVLGYRFATAMGFNCTDTLNVLFPVPQDGAFSYYGQAVIGNVYFDNFDTLIHEYGHFVEQKMGNYSASLLEIIINDPNHYASTDHFYDKEQKEYAMELTWSESWATAFSQIAQDYFSTEYSGVPGFADHTAGVNYETYTYTSSSCEAQENAVTAFLWDLFDNDTTESYDNISLPYSAWWNYTTRTGTGTLTDFVEVVETYYPSNRSPIGEIMASHHISPGNLTINNLSSVSANTPPTLSWLVNGSTTSPNNRFQIVFYDNYDNYIYSSPTMDSTQAYNTNLTYSVPLSVWNEVLKDYGGTFKINIAVRGFNSNDPISGPYISKYAAVTLTINRTLNIGASTRYTENRVKLDKGSYCDYNINFAQGGTKLIQTFGTKDTYLELYASNGTKILGKADTDDKGYSTNSLISYNFSADTDYKIRVRYYQSSTYGITKLSIIPTYQYQDYEDIYSLVDYTRGLTWSFAQNNVKVMTYKYTSQQDLTMHVSSEVDTYLYIINPRSTDLVRAASIVSPNTTKDFDCLYNDDINGSMDRNSQITKTFNSNIPYLVIVSAYNPSLSTSVGSFYVNFLD